ncbi:MAG TPA: hypothetical protein VNZ52_06585 [Candidatus Thermoplasmatota archaeon]|nr:hypothetical protein [Candidatus Thermoplasmatota archaeon]
MIAWAYRKARWFLAGRRLPPPPYGLVEVAVPAARARAFTEATLVLLLGFVLDDLRALRYPGFMVGMVGAVLLLAFGSAVHARSMAAHCDGMPLAKAEARLRILAGAWRLAAIGSVLLFVLWLALTSGGIDLWPA